MSFPQFPICFFAVLIYIIIEEIFCQTRLLLLSSISVCRSSRCRRKQHNRRSSCKRSASVSCLNCFLTCCRILCLFPVCSVSAVIHCARTLLAAFSAVLIRILRRCRIIFHKKGVSCCRKLFRRVIHGLLVFFCKRFVIQDSLCVCQRCAERLCAFFCIGSQVDT